MFEQLVDVLVVGGVDVVLLDNMDMLILICVVEMIDGMLVSEVLGNMKFDRIVEVVVIGVNYILFGVFIYLVSILDFGFDF